MTLFEFCSSASQWWHVILLGRKAIEKSMERTIKLPKLSFWVIFKKFETLLPSMQSMYWPCRSFATQTHRHAKQFFFILEPCKLYANLKKLHSVTKEQWSSARLQSADVCAGMQQCSEFLTQLWCLPLTAFQYRFEIFWNNANTSMTVDLFGPWQVHQCSQDFWSGSGLSPK